MRRRSLSRRRESRPTPNGVASKASSLKLGKERFALGALAVLYALILVTAGAHPSSLLWGVDLFAYLRTGPRAALTCLLAIGVALLLVGILRGKRAETSSQVHKAAQWPRMSLLFALVLIAIIAWVLRDHSHLLGDGLTWIELARTGQRASYSEPLAAAAMFGIAPLSGSNVAVGFALLSVACGLLAAVLYYLLARSIASGAPAATATALLFTLGANQLYFGYVESYPVASVAILIYLWILLRCWRREADPTLAALALSVAIGSHFIAVVLVPSYLLLILRTHKTWVRTTILLGLPAALVATVLALLHYPVDRIFDPLRLVTGTVSSPADRTASLIVNSLRRIPHLMNLCLLVAPLPLLVVLARIATMRPRNTDMETTTVPLLAAAIPASVVAFLLCLFVFPGHDWDLVTMALLPGIVLAVGGGSRWLGKPPWQLAAGLTTIGAVSLLAFVLVNADEASAIQRYSALLADDLPLSAHERAYGNERLVKIYTNRREPEKALLYARRALAADSANDRYWANVGSTLYNLKRYEEAIRFYEAAARRGSSRPDVYYYLAQSLIRVARPQDALGPAQKALELGGERLNYVFTLGLARAESGDLNGARRAWDHLLNKWPGDGRTMAAYEYYLRGR